MRHENQTQASGETRLTQGELSTLLNEAIARHGEAQRRVEAEAGMASLDDALEIARMLNVPEEHVLAAAEELQRRRARELKRGILRERRRRSFLATAGIALALVALLALFAGGLASLTVIFVAAAGLVASFLAWRRIGAPATDEELDRLELPPVPGLCQVCWQKAATPRSTLCEEHRYQGPGAGGS